VKGATTLYAIAGLLSLVPAVREGFLDGAGNPEPGAVLGGAILLYPIVVVVFWMIAAAVNRQSP
jgi:hypothetical protein